MEIGVHEEGEESGEGVEGGISEVLLALALGAEHEEAALGETGREIGTDDDLDGEELREGGGEDAEGGGLLGIESGEVVRQEVVGGGGPEDGTGGEEALGDAVNGLDDAGIVNELGNPPHHAQTHGLEDVELHAENRPGSEDGIADVGFESGLMKTEHGKKNC